MEERIKQLKSSTLDFVSKRHHDGEEIGAHYYSANADKPTLYSSTYAAMLKSLYNSLPAKSECNEWASYLNGFQDDDGLFKDPVIYGEGWYKKDPLTCGRPHLSCHVIVALACLGSVAERPISWLKPWLDIDYLIKWLEERDWGTRVAWSGNEIMNIGTLLQYERDFHNCDKSQKAIYTLLEWLGANHVNPDTGVWGGIDVGDNLWRSHAVQAAYHWWPLFFYDHFPIPYPERAIDTILATQNPCGGFGWGVHNPAEPFKSSACEDIDSIDPLCRITRTTSYREAEIRAVLGKATNWILTNQTADGGFVFIKDRPFEYGHSQLRGNTNQGAMFPTWFRTLSLAYIGKILKESELYSYPWHFVRCPGFQFWE